MDDIAKKDPNALLETLCSKILSTNNHQRKELLIQITRLVGLEQSIISRRQRQDQNPVRLLQSSKPSHQLEPLQRSQVGITDPPLPSQPQTSNLDSTSDPLTSSSPSLSVILQNCSSKTDHDVRTILLRSVSKLLSESNSSSELFNQADGFLDASASFQTLVESLRSSLNPSKASTIASSSDISDLDLVISSISALKCAAASLKAIHSFFNSLSSSNSNDTSSTRSKLSSTLLLLQPQQVSDLVSLLLKASSTGLERDPQSSSSSGRSSSLGHSDSSRGRRLSGNTPSRPSNLAGSGRVGGGIVGGGALGGFVSSSSSSSTSPQKASGSTYSLGKAPSSSPSKSHAKSQLFPSLGSRSSNASLKETPSQMEGEIRHDEIDDEASSASEIEGSQGFETASETGFDTSRGDSSARGGGDSCRKKRLLEASRGVRMNAIACLLSLNEHSPNQVYSHWTSLFPDSSSSTSTIQPPSTATTRPSRFIPPSTSSTSFSLFILIERDPALSVRIAAAHAIEVILAKGNQKGWLAAAEERSTRVASFTSLSARLGSIVVGLRSKIATFLSTPPTGKTHSRSNSSVSPSSLGAGQNRTEKPSFNQPAALLEVVLRLAKTLVTSTSNAKLRQTHMEVLRQPVLGLCSHPEPSIAVAAYSLLSALISSPSGGSNGIPGPGSLSPSMQPSRAAATTSSLAQSDSLSSAASDVDSHAVRELLDQLSHQEASDIVKAQLWSTLATFAGNRREALRPHESSCLELLESSFPSKSESVRQGAATFLLTFLRSEAEEVSNSTEIRHLPQGSQAFHSVCKPSKNSTEGLSSSNESSDKSQILPRIVSLVRNDDSPIVRTLLADSLPYWDSLLRSSASVQGDVGTKMILSSLLGDQEAAVRAAAVRALGVVLMDGLKLDSEGARRGESASFVVPTLEFSLEVLVGSSSTSSKGALEDEALLVQVRASWTLANLCEVYFSNRSYLVSSETHQNFWFILLQAALSSSKKEERVSLNALRAFGALFGSLKSEWLESSPDQELESIILSSTEAIKRLCGVVWVNTTIQPSTGSSNQGGSPKLKWNAASSLGRALGSPDVRSWMSEKQEIGQESLLSRTVLSLSSSLHSKTFKVKLASAHALLQLPITTWSDESLISKETFQFARESCDLASERIDDLIRSASFSEGNLHGEPTKVAMKQLKDLLDETEGLRNSRLYL